MQKVETILNFERLESSTTSAGVRHYITPNGLKYPSITTVLSATADKGFLVEWKKRVGEEKANKIAKEATDNGSALHLLLEKYALGENSPNAPNHLVSSMFKHGRRLIDAHVQTIKAEVNVFSDKLGVAGSTDLLCYWDGAPAVLDWKNRGVKPFRLGSEMGDYKLQLTFYSTAIFEMTGLSTIAIIASLNIFGSNIVKFDPFSDKLQNELQFRISQYKEMIRE